jgi:hypothetical protein
MERGTPQFRREPQLPVGAEPGIGPGQRLHGYGRGTRGPLQGMQRRGSRLPCPAAVHHVRFHRLVSCATVAGQEGKAVQKGANLRASTGITHAVGKRADNRVRCGSPPCGRRRTVSGETAVEEATVASCSGNPLSGATTEVTGTWELRTSTISAMMDMDFDHGRPSIGTVT